MGTSSEATHSTGASRSSKQFRDTSQARWEPTLATGQASSTTTQRWVRRTDSHTTASSSGRSDRRSTTSASIPSAARTSAASSATRMGLEKLTTVTSRPGRRTTPWPRGTRYSPSGTSPVQAYISSASRKITGLSSRIALLRSPLASYGVDGAATFNPGTWAKKLCSACECWAARYSAGPLGPRNTMGTGIWPPDM